VKSEALHVPGFQRLNWLLPQHIDVPEVYFLLMALMMGQPVKLLPADSSKLDLDSVWNFMFGVPASQCVTSVAGRVSLCPEVSKCFHACMGSDVGFLPFTMKFFPDLL
jgi:hypothetical protein